MAEKGYSYSWGLRVCHYIAIVLTILCLVAIAWRLVLGIHDALSLMLLFLSWVAGWLVADLASGMVHWSCDRLGSEKTPLLGPVIFDFREHHVWPKKILDCDSIGTTGNTSFICFVGLSLVLLFYPDVTHSYVALFGLGTLFFSAIGGLLTNEFHRWAHMQRPPRLVRVLQRCHLILGPRHHEVHHSGSFDAYYCITVGWLNAPLRWIRYFEALEWIIYKITGRHCGRAVLDQEDALRKGETPARG